MEERETRFRHDPFARRKSLQDPLRRIDPRFENQTRRDIAIERQLEIKFRVKTTLATIRRATRFCCSACCIIGCRRKPIESFCGISACIGWLTKPNKARWKASGTVHCEQII